MGSKNDRKRTEPKNDHRTGHRQTNHLKQGPEKLNTNERHFQRILSRYRKEGNVGRASGHRGKQGNYRRSERKRQAIVESMGEAVHPDERETGRHERDRESKENLRQIMMSRQDHDRRRLKNHV